MEKSTENNTNKDLFFKHLGQTSPEPVGLEIERSEGVRLFGPQEKSYIDLISGVGVSNIGHAHPKVVDAILEQSGAYSHIMVYGEFIQAPQVQYAELLASQLPESLQSVYFVNSGSEAVEAALKLAKRLTGRRELIGCKHAYHGSTHGALSLMGDESFKQSFRPLLPAVQQIRFNHVEDLSLITKATAAVLIEPVQAEAGVILPQAGYLEALQARCRQTGTLLIFDEVQTGFGRTGALFAFQKYGVIPDILCLAKALGGGMPLGALVTGADLMKAWQSDPALGHITTFGGHPICCAAGMAALKVILEQNLPEEAEEKGQWFKEYLANHNRILEMHGVGLLWACRLSSEEEAKNFVVKAAEEGIISDRFLFCGSAFRISPPLTINFQEIDEACMLIARALDCL